MGIIIAYGHNGVVHVATDSFVAVGDKRMNGENTKFVHVMKGGLIVGVCGSRKVAQSLFSRPEIFGLEPDVALTKEYIVMNMIPEIIDALDEDDCFDKEEEFTKLECSILLIWKDCIFEISSGFGVNKYRHYCSDGNAGHYCEYALGEMDEAGDIDSQLAGILEIAHRHSSIVEPPYYVIDTKDLQFKRMGD